MCSTIKVRETGTERVMVKGPSAQRDVIFTSLRRPLSRGLDEPVIDLRPTLSDPSRYLQWGPAHVWAPSGIGDASTRWCRLTEDRSRFCTQQVSVHSWSIERKTGGTAGGCRLNRAARPPATVATNAKRPRRSVTLVGS